MTEVCMPWVLARELSAMMVIDNRITAIKRLRETARISLKQAKLAVLALHRGEFTKEGDFIIVVVPAAARIYCQI